LPLLKRITIICPVYNEEEVIPIFYQRLVKSLTSFRSRYQFELLFTNNRSEDGSLEAIKALRRRDPMVQVLTLSRNFGYQASLQAGLVHARGDAIIIIDVDCEDPPEMVGEFIEKWEEGYDIVYGIRIDRPETWLLKQGRNFFYRLLKRVADMDINLYMAEFSIITGRVKEHLVNTRNTFPFLRAEIGYAGFKQHGIPYVRQRRAAGRTHYRMVNMFAFGIGGLLTSSTFLLRLAAYLFFPFAFINLLSLPAILGANGAEAFRVLMIFDWLYLMLFLTVHGVYIARIYKIVIGRPLFIVDWTLSLLDEGAPPS